MRIVVAGDWHSDIHEAPVADALVQLGHVVSRFAWSAYFIRAPGVGLGRLLWLSNRIQFRYQLGPAVQHLNRDLLDLIAREQPDGLFIYRGTHVTPGTLKRIKAVSPKTALVGYCNDDPFSPQYPWWMWRHFRGCLAEYDLVLAYRHQNLAELVQAGARRVKLWRSWFVPEQNHPVALTAEERRRYECDVVFVGHYEPDQRISFLEAVAREGYNLRIFGPDYPNSIDSPHLAHLLPIRAVRGTEYNKALCGAKIALCFLSRLNRDTYTRRSFEIPATRTMMLSVYSEDLGALFCEGRDAAFFRTEGELVRNVTFYLSNEKERMSVAAAGYRRVWADHHDVLSRAKELSNWMVELQTE